MNRLKKRALFGLLILFSVLMLTSATKSTLFTKSVTITKIYPHKMGYRVIYLTSALEFKEIYLPVDLFKIENGSKIFYGNNEAFPYMQIFWQNGEFSHVKLYVMDDFRDITWGSLNNPDQYNDFFTTDKDNIKFDF